MRHSPHKAAKRPLNNPNFFHMPDRPPMPYRRIRDLREDADLSQRELAEMLHMHKTTYVRYETGERELPFSIAILLAKHYKVSLDYLAGLTDHQK